MAMKTCNSQNKRSNAILMVLVILVPPALCETSKERSSLFLLTSLMIPGSGQALCGHPVKGATFLAFEGILGAMAYEEHSRYSLAHLRAKAEAGSLLGLLGDTLEALNEEIEDLDSLTDSLVARFASLREDSVRQENRVVVGEGGYANSIQLRNIYAIWAGGLYIFNLFDAIQVASRRRAPVSGPKNTKIAVWSSLLFPGLGQIYNNSYGKAGMIWMAQGALAVSAVYRHRMYTGYQAQLDLVREDSSLAAMDSSVYRWRMNEMESRRNYFRRARNSHIWYSIGFYFYNVFDAFVDAHLHSFDDRLEIALFPEPDGEVAVKVDLRFPLRRSYLRSGG